MTASPDACRPQVTVENVVVDPAGDLYLLVGEEVDKFQQPWRILVSTKGMQFGKPRLARNA